MIRTFIAAVLLGVVLAQPAAAQNVDGFRAAWDRGDYATAFRESKLLAEQGDAEAQYFLGHFYKDGQGVPQHYAEAVKWLRKAAQQGHAAAQNSLGYTFKEGLVAPPDYVRAHMWFNLASAQKPSGPAERNRNEIAESMTRAQIAEAQKLARECLARKYKGCD